LLVYIIILNEISSLTALLLLLRGVHWVRW